MAILNLSEYKDHPALEQSPGLRRVLQLFDGISSHPRPSKSEMAVRKHLLSLAGEQGWEVVQDDIGNVAIFVDATPGKEDITPVILQGHMDIVTAESDAHLPREAVIVDQGQDGKEKGLWLRTKNQDMTLGADNGMGLSMAMGAMMDPTLEHGPVTILMTIDEETGMSGAKKLDPRLLTNSAILINLDSEEGPVDICIGCAGSSDVVARFPIEEREAIPESYELLRIKLTGFPGGHSGIMIHEANGNAIQSLGQLLTRIREITDLRLLSVEGGMKRNSIPKDAEALIAVPEGERSRLQEIADQLVKELKMDKEVPNPQVSGVLSREKAQKVEVVIEEVKENRIGALQTSIHEQLVGLLGSLPTGPFASAELPNVGSLVTLSNNLGIVRTREDHIEVVSMARAANIQDLRAKLTEIEELFRSHGASCEVDEPSAGWLEDPHTSAAAALARDAARQTFGEPKLLAYHAGLESGIIGDRSPGQLSAVAIGPLILEAHTERERASLDSIAQVVLVLRRMLEMVA